LRPVSVTTKGITTCHPWCRNSNHFKSALANRPTITQLELLELRRVSYKAESIIHCYAPSIRKMRYIAPLAATITKGNPISQAWGEGHEKAVVKMVPEQCTYVAICSAYQDVVKPPHGGSLLLHLLRRWCGQHGSPETSVQQNQCKDHDECRHAPGLRQGNRGESERRSLFIVHCRRGWFLGFIGVALAAKQAGAVVSQVLQRAEQEVQLVECKKPFNIVLHKWNNANSTREPPQSS